VKILIADDEPMIRELLRATLSRDPRFEVTLVPDGQAAIEGAREHQPDFVILDVRMPDVDGLEACRTIRDELGDDVRIVMLTALGQDADVARGRAAGADDYFIKPFSPNQLLGRVCEVAGIAA